MSSESDRLTRKLRRAMNRQTKTDRLQVMLLSARMTIQDLRRRVKTLRKALAERETSLSLALASLRRSHPNWAPVPSPKEDKLKGLQPEWVKEFLLGPAEAARMES